MARGMWRWWEGKRGAETWWAHVEQRPGEWLDIEADRYERAGHQPPFWSLPLKEEYLEARLAHGIAPRALVARERKVMLPAIIGMIIFGGTFFVVLVVAAALFAKVR